MTEPSRWTQLRKRFSDGFNRWESAVERIPARRFLAELPWLVGVLLGWRICWRDGDAMVLDERVTGYQWADYMNNCWLVANRITERYDGWRGIVHAGICGSAGEALGNYPNGAILVASVSVFILIFCAGLAARALGGAWAGFLAAMTLAWVPTVSQAAHWGNSTPVIAAGTAVALAFGSVAMRWPKIGFAAVAGAGACLAWAADKRGLLIIPGVVGMGVVAALFAPKMAEGKLGVVALGHALRKRLPEAAQSRLQTPAKLQRPMTWLTLNQRKVLILPAMSLGLLVFPLTTAWLGQTTNTEWESQMDAESMRQVHDGTAQRWTQSAELDRRWTNWEGMSPELGRWVPPFTSVIRSGGSSGRDTELMNRCKDLVEDEFLVVPDFFYTDCSRATLAHNTRENLAKITALPLGLVWISLPLCLLPAKQRWKGVLSGGALLAAVWAMWLAMASLNVMPTRYLIQFTVGASLMVPVGMGRLIYTVFPQSLAWLVSGLCGLGLWSWTTALDINDRDSEHTWSYNDSVKGGLNDYYAHSQQLREYLEPEDDFLDCSDKGLSIWLLPDYTRFGTPLLKVDDAGRCMQWISWAPENGTRWIAIDPACKYRPQDAPQGGPQANNKDSHVSLEPSLQTNGWDLVLDSYPDDSRNSLRGPRAQSQQIQCGEGRFQLWKRES